jgi:hypothetical protein
VHSNLLILKRDGQHSAEHVTNFAVVIFKFATFWHIENFIVHLDNMPKSLVKIKKA